MEFTIRAVVLGLLLALLLGAANAYLGLKVGMTVSASIPAAVISFAILRWFKNANILENNLVQTAASAGESLAAGMIFTIPALILLGIWDQFNYLQTTLLITIGGVLGVLIAVPIRKALIENKHAPKELTFPEGLATAEVLKSGYSGAGSIRLLGTAGLMAALIKFLQSGLGVASSSITGAYQSSRTVFGIGMELSPALVAVGVIVRLRIASLMFAGGLIIWLIAMPIYSWFHPQPMSNDAMQAAFILWSTKLRFIGVGAMLVAGLWVLFIALKPVWSAIRHSFKQSSPEQDKSEFSIRISLLWCLVLCVPLAWVFHSFNQFDSTFTLVALLFSLLAAVLFSIVAAYMAGLVGSSNNPISGVTIATIFLAGLVISLTIPFTIVALMQLFDATPFSGLTILIGGVVCCAAAISGDTMQDLKAGQLVGATPRYQTWMQLLGVVAAGVILIPVLQLLYDAYGIAGHMPRPDMDPAQVLAAPQASLMKSIAEGMFSPESLEWNLIYIGMLISVFLIIIDQWLKANDSKVRIPAMAVAVGMYLPITLSVPIFVGGLLAHVLVSRGQTAQQSGTLFASGLIAGEAIIGILLAIPFAIVQDTSWFYLFDSQNMTWNYLLGIAMIMYVSYLLVKSSTQERQYD